MRPTLDPRVLAPRVLASLALSAIVLAAPGASAQPVDPAKLAAAQTLFEQAQAAMDRKDYASACPKLEEVTKILPNGVGGLMLLARCYEGTGKLASAWSTYVVAETAAAQSKRPEVERQARDRIRHLRPKLAQLTIAVPDAIQHLPGLTITRDGAPVGAAQWGTPMPVDKGSHLVAATATGKQRWEQDVQVPEGGASISVAVTASLADAPAVVPPPTDKGPETPTFWGPLHIAGAAGAGAGLVLVIVGSAFGGVAISKKNQSNDGHCTATTCDATGYQLRSDGLTAASVSTGTFVTGAIALAAGVTLLAIPFRKPATTGASPWTTTRIGLGPGSIDLSVKW